MKKQIRLIICLFGLLVLSVTSVSAAENHQKVYDDANLLTENEINRLAESATEYSEKWETDFIILTTNDAQDVERYTEDFYDEQQPGFDKPAGNTAILTVDMEHREVYLAGFYKAEEYLDSQRLDLIREKITPYLTSGDYYDAFMTYLHTADEYMGIRPGVNPNNILLNGWFHLFASLGIAAIIVGVMAFNTGGKVTVNQNTYMNPNNSKVLNKKDVYLRKTVTKRRKPSDNNNRSGGGGGVTRGGHSHSGSRGSF